MFLSSVIWLNEKAEDFALYGELEKAFFRNHRKLDVSCIVERDLFGHHLDSNAMVREAAPEFKIGTLAAVAGVLSFCVFLPSFVLVRRAAACPVFQLARAQGSRRGSKLLGAFVFSQFVLLSIPPSILFFVCGVSSCIGRPRMALAWQSA